jgi:hypothetical protein
MSDNDPKRIEPQDRKDETWLKQYVDQVNAGFKSEQEILDGLEYINKTLLLQGLERMTLE